MWTLRASLSSSGHSPLTLHIASPWPHWGTERLRAICAGNFRVLGARNRSRCDSQAPRRHIFSISPWEGAQEKNLEVKDDLSASSVSIKTESLHAVWGGKSCTLQTLPRHSASTPSAFRKHRRFHSIPKHKGPCPSRFHINSLNSYWCPD